ncbi:MAG: CDP-glycerol glycerophosphotransferase family protein, partial [Bacilli bacterium]
MKRKQKRKIKRKIKKWLFIGSYYLFKFLPINKKKVIAQSYFGRSISDNPYALALQLKKQDYKIVYFIKRKTTPLDDDFEYVYINSFKYFYYLSTIKLIISNTRMPYHWHKRFNQVYLQTWHGTPLKKLVYDLDKVDMALTKDVEKYQNLFYHDVKRWDYLISSSTYTTKCFKSAFHYDKTFLEYGYPRNDVLLNNDESKLIDIKRKLDLPLDKKIILYAPTYRDNQNTGVGRYYFNSTLDYPLILQEFEDHIVLVRYHYMITKTEDTYNEQVINVSSYPNISDLYLISDILITDYSSVIFDFALLNKPFYLYCDDLESYRDDLRGFYIDIEKDLPCPIALDTNMLIQ